MSVSQCRHTRQCIEIPSGPKPILSIWTMVNFLPAADVMMDISYHTIIEVKHLDLNHFSIQ